jgi:hypothetical protein
MLKVRYVMNDVELLSELKSLGSEKARTTLPLGDANGYQSPVPDSCSLPSLRSLA